MVRVRYGAGGVEYIEKDPIEKEQPKAAKAEKVEKKKKKKKSTREFLRKWGSFVYHNNLLKPIIPSKYDIGFILNNSMLSSINLFFLNQFTINHDSQLLATLEPWCSTVYTRFPFVKDYIDFEQNKTSFNLQDRIKPYDNEKNNEILVEIDCSKFDQQDFSIIQHLPQIIKDSGEIGNFSIGNLKITIVNLQTYEKELIVCTS